MSKSRLVTNSIKELEFELAKQKAVQKEFPNAKIHHYVGFRSKDVNQSYTKFEFYNRPYGVWAVPYCEVKLDFDGKTEIIKVHSCPKANRLVYLGWDRNLRDNIIKFSRIAFNIKNNGFKDEMLNSCRAEIMTFIKNNPKYKLDDKHLEPRLKRLLIFT